MATGVIQSFLVQPPGYFPLMFQPSPLIEQDEEQTPPHQDEEEEREEEEDLPEEEEDEEVYLERDSQTLDVTNQLLRFADLISRDVQRYFGRSGGDQDACDIYNDSVSMTTGGRLRYYDDLLKIAKGGNPEEQERGGFKPSEDGQTVTKNTRGLGPLAELFDQKGLNLGRPMIKRHLPLSFWTEPVPGLTSDNDIPQKDNAYTINTQYDTLQQHTHGLDGTQPDFSDLLANWDPHPELPPALTENTH